VWFRRKPKADPSEVARDLRNLALAVDAATLGLRPTTSHTRVWGVLMETGYPEGVATLVAFGDGTASLYFSGGGGIIGAGEHAAVREAIHAFLQEADEHLRGFVPTATTPLPATGRVRFICAPSRERWPEKRANRTSVTTTTRSRHNSTQDKA
jgi:hypothetical protein